MRREVLEFFVVYGDGRKHWTAILISRIDGQRYAGDGATPWIAIANSLAERASRQGAAVDVTIPPGKVTCSACGGRGQASAFVRCSACDGIGVVWAPGGPRFGCVHELGEQTPGSIVELATGHRGRVAWHMPRPSKKVPAEITFVRLISDFDDVEDDTPTAFHSTIGVASVAPYTRGGDLHDGEKAADAVDPLARRLEEAGQLV